MNRHIKIGITHGDYNGVGYEVILKTLQDSRIFELFTPILYGSPQILSYYRKLLDINIVPPINIIKTADEALADQLNIIPTDTTGLDINVMPGEPSRYAGTLAARALNDARRDVIEQKIDAVVTAPINKDTIQSSDFIYKGHTEFFASAFEKHEPMMLFVANDIRVAIATIHIPLSEVSTAITKELLLSKISLLEQTLIQDFAIEKPRIAVLGLNPHSGENGLLGSEEINVITPAIQEAWAQGTHCFGPISPDGFWGSASYEHFDATLCMYHDQGLIPFKLLAMSEGVNITCGLPIIRTSPDHGTAYDIAGSGEALEESFRNALYQAIDIHRNRQSYIENTKDPLKKRYVERGSDNYKLDLSKSGDEDL